MIKLRVNIPLERDCDDVGAFGMMVSSPGERGKEKRGKRTREQKEERERMGKVEGKGVG